MGLFASTRNNRFILYCLTFFIVSSFIYLKHVPTNFTSDQSSTQLSHQVIQNDGFINNNNYNNGTKTILLWTKFFGTNYNHLIGLFPDFTIHTEGGVQCQLSMDRHTYSKSDAVVFHGRDLTPTDVLNPSKRYRNQLWIYYTVESPLNSACNATCWKFINGIGFNWIMSYHRTLSHSYFPYGKLLENTKQDQQNKTNIEMKIKQFASSFTQRPKDAIWIVSNCK